MDFDSGNAAETNCRKMPKVYKNAEVYAQELLGEKPTVIRLPGAGSDRVYVRMRNTDDKSVILTSNTDKRENETFISLANVFRKAGHNVPEIYAVSEDALSYFQEDLGDVSLFSLLGSPERIPLSGKVLEQLARLQVLPEYLWNDKVFSSPFSERQVRWDLNYFKYEMLKPSGILFDEDLLEDDFRDMADLLTSIPEEYMGFMYRDFQSRNMMVRNDDLWFIDFQGGRKGPLVYDAVSFLWQAKAGFSREEREILFNQYVEKLVSLRALEREELYRELPLFVVFRTLQVLGAYGFRGLVERKAHFIESLPKALRNLSELLEEGCLDIWPELRRICGELVRSRYAKEPSEGKFKVQVFSFSYKKGYPEDLSGNGGGFMFDCRGMHNPGRYDEFKSKTGMDKEVIHFLAERGEADKFVGNALNIVTPSVDTYLRRGFSLLQVGFGCTGGQHRSVYCAESFSRKLREKYPDIDIFVVHREQSMSYKLES